MWSDGDWRKEKKKLSHEVGVKKKKKHSNGFRKKTKHGRKAKPYRLKLIEILSSSHDIDQIFLLSTEPQHEGNTQEYELNVNSD